jgi:hypothetical protein
MEARGKMPASAQPEQGPQREPLVRSSGRIAHDCGSGPRVAQVADGLTLRDLMLPVFKGENRATRTYEVRSRNPRSVPDKKRAVTGASFWRHSFSKLISLHACVLDMGFGQGDFINSVVARRRIALDTWPDFPQYVAAGIEADDFLADGSVEFASANNLYGRLTQSEFVSVLMLRMKLRDKGTLMTLQPNYRYAYREHCDDYPHVAIYSDVSIAVFLVANNYEVSEGPARFLINTKSCLPVSTVLICAYSNSPVHPMGKPRLVRAKPLR